MASDRLKRALGGFVWTLLGRSRMVRFGQFLVNTGPTRRVGRPRGPRKRKSSSKWFSLERKIPWWCSTSGPFAAGGPRACFELRDPQPRAFEVYLFEPSEENHAILLERMATFPQTAKLHPIKVGLSDRSGDGTFFVAGTGGTNSMVTAPPPDAGHDDGDGSTDPCGPVLPGTRHRCVEPSEKSTPRVMISRSSGARKTC